MMLREKQGTLTTIFTAKMTDADYFASDEFKRRADACTKENFGITSVSESKRIYVNYLKSQKAIKKGK